MRIRQGQAKARYRTKVKNRKSQLALTCTSVDHYSTMFVNLNLLLQHVRTVMSKSYPVKGSTVTT